MTITSEDNLTPQERERLRRWRLMLGGSADGTGMQLGGRDAQMDAVLEALYGQGMGQGQGGDGEEGDNKSLDRRGGMQESMPNVSRWLGDIRKYFPSSVVQVMQKDAIEKIGLR